MEPLSICRGERMRSPALRNPVTSFTLRDSPLSPGQNTHEVTMRLQLAAVLSLLITIANAQTPPQKSSYASETPPSAESAYSPQLRGELTALRQAALTDDYAY